MFTAISHMKSAFGVGQRERALERGSDRVRECREKKEEEIDYVKKKNG